MTTDPVSYPSGALRAAAAGDEAALVARAQRGEAEAFDQLIRRHQQTVFAVAVPMLGDRDEAQDVDQDVFVRAYQGFGAFRQDAALSTWLVSITINLCRNKRRWWARRKRLIVASLDDPLETSDGTLAHEVADPSPTPASAAQSWEQRERLAATLQLLDSQDREMIVLRDVQGYAYEEIATMLRVRLGTVKSRLNRARLRLRALLNGRLE